MDTKYSPENPHFLTVILKRTIEEQKLRIPVAFAKRYSHTLPDKVKLIVPTGDIWSIELNKRDGQLSLEKGWPQFANHYSLDFGNLLVFGYQGNDIFKVVIFDRTAAEVQYAPAERVKEIDDDDEYDMSLEKLKHSLSKKKKNLKRAKKTGGSGCRPVRARIEFKAYEKSRDFKSENPYFIAALKSSSLGSRLHIPTKFAVNYLVEENSHVILTVSDGRRWTLPYSLQRYNCSRSGTRSRTAAYLTAKWRNIVQENDLKFGDVCVFELVKNTNTKVLKLTIFRGENKERPCSSSPGNSGRTLKRKRSVLADERDISNIYFKDNDSSHTDPYRPTKNIQGRGKVRPKNSSDHSYTIVISSRCVSGHSTAYVPTKFAEKHFRERHGDVVLCMEDGRKWDAKYRQANRFGKRAEGYITCGWKNFVDDNQLKLRDTCVFQLIKRDPMTLKVDILRSA